MDVLDGTDTNKPHMVSLLRSWSMYPRYRPPLMYRYSTGYFEGSYLHLPVRVAEPCGLGVAHVLQTTKEGE